MGAQENGDISYFKSTSSYFCEVTSSGDNVLRNLSTTNNVSGAFLVTGPAQLVVSGTNFLFLNNTAIDENARTVDFQGLMSNLRFWSCFLSEDEWREHIRNFKSLGVENPLINYNYNKTSSGSFGRIRLDTLTKQTIRRANATASLDSLGSITFLDFSENNMHMTGSGFPIDQDCVIGDVEIGRAHV